MTATTPCHGAMSRPYPASTEMNSPPPEERLHRTPRIIVAAQRAETSHALAGALHAGDDSYAIELLQSPLRRADGLRSAACNLLLIQNELIEQPLEPCLEQLLQQQPQRRILVFGVGMNDDYLSRLVRAGAHGYLNTPAEPAEIRLAAQQVLAGNAWMEQRVVSNCVSAPGSAAEQMAATLGSNIDSMCQELTRREKEILCQVIRGYAIKQIAAEVHLSHQGVKMHLARLFRKFGASNRNQLILAVLDRISPVKDLSASLCSGLRSNLMETAG
ncbi:MAG: response regulator transcription factor [Gammaproteobacteria bacterium]|nr:MAG: response regulator transcription factor [Gammaproteobacteria bacterium]